MVLGKEGKEVCFRIGRIRYGFSFGEGFELGEINGEFFMI